MMPSSFRVPLLVLLGAVLALTDVRAQEATAPAPAAPPAPAAVTPAPAAPGVAVAENPAAPQPMGEVFDLAMTAYQAGKLEEARTGFLAIVEKGELSAGLAHNLGNIEFRKGNPGQAVLWYRRALALDPLQAETLQNLRTIRRQTAFLSFDRWVWSLAYLKSRWILNGTVVLAWVCGLLMVWLVWVTPRPGRRWPVVLLLSLAGPALAVGSLLTWRLKSDPAPIERRQIVSGEAAMAYAAPAEASTSVISLPSGSEVVPVETRGNWIYCMIPGGQDGEPLRGWIRAAEVEPLWPYAAKI